LLRARFFSGVLESCSQPCGVCPLSQFALTTVTRPCLNSRSFFKSTPATALKMFALSCAPARWVFWDDGPCFVPGCHSGRRGGRALGLVRGRTFSVLRRVRRLFFFFVLLPTCGSWAFSRSFFPPFFFPRSPSPTICPVMVPKTDVFLPFPPFGVFVVLSRSVFFWKGHQYSFTPPPKKVGTALSSFGSILPMGMFGRFFSPPPLDGSNGVPSPGTLPSSLLDPFTCDFTTLRGHDLIFSD